MRILLVIALVVAGHGVAEACKRGKTIYRAVQEPMPGHDDAVPNATFEITSSGRWSRVQEMPAGQEPASWGGCLSRPHLKELKRAIKRARFRQGEPAMCDAVTEVQVEHRAPQRKKSARMSTPCGETVDASTALLIECAALASDGKVSGKQAKAVCRGGSK